MKQEAAKEQKEFNKRHGIVPQKPQRRKSIYVAKPHADNDDNDDNDEKSVPPEPKKQKISNDNESADIESPTKQVTKRRKAQIKLPVKTPKKSQKNIPKQTPLNETNDDVHDATISNDNAIANDSNAINGTNGDDVENTTEMNKLDQQSEPSDVNDRIDSEAASSSTSTGSKKRSKKEKKAETAVEEPGDKPPSSLFEYFARYVHTGKPRKAQKAFDKLTKHEEKRLKLEYNETVESYVERLKKYLASIPKEEAILYVSITSDSWISILFSFSFQLSKI